VPNSPVATKRPFAVVVAPDAKLRMETTVDETTVRLMKADLKGFATMTGQSETSFPVSVVSVATTPGVDGRYRVTLTAEYPQDLTVVAGMIASAQVTAYQAKSVITIPVKALRSNGEGGWEVELQENEKTVKKVTVKRGKTWGEKVEILSGLEKDQTIIVPGA